MLVRAYDEQSGVYFTSKVYAVVNSGWYGKYLLAVPSDVSSDGGGYFKFFDYLDKSGGNIHKALINTINADLDDGAERIYKRSGGVDEKIKDFEEFLDKDERFFEYNGFLWVYENRDFLLKLLKGGTVPAKDYADKLTDYKIAGWNYVETVDDAGFLMEQTCSFHDSVLKEMNYVSGSYVDGEKRMACSDSEKRVTMRFDSQNCQSIELVFEGVIAMSLYPAPDNYSSDIFGASLFLRDGIVFFCDYETEEIDRDCERTRIEAYSLRWRFCGEI